MIKRYLGTTSLLLIPILLIGLWYFFCPLFNPAPKPTGPYCVGYIYNLLTITSLESSYNSFTIELLYPSNCSNKSSSDSSYQVKKMNALAMVKAADSWLPTWLWQCMLGTGNSTALHNGAIIDSNKTLPIVIYLPGIGGEDLHAVYLEELASNGYIVCAIQPPLDTAVTVLPNNVILPLNSSLKTAMQESNREAIYTYRNQAHKRWPFYIEFVIEHLRQLNEDSQSIFYKKLNFDRIGLLGSSHGGAVATDFCQHHKTCKAGINMDGWTKTYNVDSSFDTPFLFMLSERGQMPEMQPFFDNNRRPNFKKMIILGAGHGAFNDFVLIKQPISRWLGIVTGDTNNVITQIKTAIITFFDRYLKDNE